MAGTAIETVALCKRFGRHVALDHLDLAVPSGTVFGYLGPNGAGKSTTIRVLMGLISSTSGTASVLGLDVSRRSVELSRRVGYLPGDFVAYRDLTVGDYLSYVAHLRGGVRASDVDVLVERFEVDPGRRIGTLSHGNRQKVGLIQATMHRPDLLVLDEPTSGLDPLMQREFLQLLREFRDEGRTVFLSSHVLAEVEAVADMVAIIRDGRLVTTSDIDELRARTRRRVELAFADHTAPPVETLSRLDSVTICSVEGDVVALEVEGSMAELMAVAAPFGIDRVVSANVDLEDAFLQYYADEGR